MLARRIFASAYSFWPTATSTDEKQGGVSENWTKESGRHSGTTLTDATRDWPTPRTVTGGAESQERKQELGRTESGGGDLQAAAGLWQTPIKSHGGGRGGDRMGEALLKSQARDWMTPSANDHKGSFKEGQRRGQLSEQTEAKGPWAKGGYPTPSATRYGSSQNEGEVPHDRPSRGTPSLETWAAGLEEEPVSTAVEFTCNCGAMTRYEPPEGWEAKACSGCGMKGVGGMATYIYSHPAPTRATNGAGSSEQPPASRRRLNTAFVAWLMGYPWFWMRAEPISSAARETRLWCSKLISLSDSFFDG